MFELKKGMHIALKNKCLILNSDLIEKQSLDSSTSFYYSKDIDWEETAKLNGIDLEEEKELKKQIGNIFVEKVNKNNEKLKECVDVLKEFEKEVGFKETKGKIRPNLLPITELKDVIRVFEFGVEKYSINNWKHVKDPINEYSNSLHRHLLDYLEGEKKSNDSNLPHLAHICANALILMWFENNKEE